MNAGMFPRFGNHDQLSAIKEQAWTIQQSLNQSGESHVDFLFQPLRVNGLYCLERWMDESKA